MENKIYLKRFKKNYITYLNILSGYRARSGWFFSKGKEEIDTVPFLLTVASAMECCLNDHIIEFYNSQFDEKHAKLLIPGLLSMTLKGKLLNIVPLLTQNEFIINTDNKVYQLLVDLIKLRNGLVHNKSDYEIHEAQIVDDIDGKRHLVPDDSLIDLMNNSETDYSLGINRDIGEYHDALEEFNELFFDSYKNDDFIGNQLIIKLNKSKVDTISVTNEA